MKNVRVLDIEIEKLRLGELDEKETRRLLDRLIACEGHTKRLDQFIADEERFFERNQPSVFSAQVVARLKREASNIQIEKENEKKRIQSMGLQNNIGIGFGVLALLFLSFTAYSAIGEKSKREREKLTTQARAERLEVFEKEKATRKGSSLGDDVEALRGVKLAKKIDVLDGRWLRKFQVFYETYEPAESPDEVLLTYGRYATYLESGKDASWSDKNAPDAIEIRKRIVDYYESIGAFTRQNLAESKSEIAKSLYKVSEKEFNTMTKIRISSSKEDELKQSLKAKQDALSNIEKRLKTLMEMKIPAWSVAAHFLLASAYVDSAESIRRSFVPKRLTDKQRVAYTETLETSATKIESHALEILTKGLKIAGVDSEYIGASRVLAQTLRVKICPEDKDIELLHAAIFNLEHKGDAGFLKARSLLKNLSCKGLRRHFKEVDAFQSSVIQSPKSGSKDDFYELRIDAENLREQMTGWVCLPDQTHDAFHDSLGEADGLTQEPIMDKLGRLSIKNSISNYKDDVDACLESSNPKKKTGTVKVTFEITPSGKVTKARGLGSMKKTSVSRCIVKVVSRMTFPATRAKKNQTITYPFSVRYILDLWSGEDLSVDSSEEENVWSAKEKSVLSRSKMRKRKVNYYQEAFGHLTRTNYRKAIATCKKGLKAKEKRCNRILGIAYKNVGDMKNACKYYKKAGMSRSKLNCN